MISGNELRKLRLNRQLTIKRIAQLIGVSASTYRDWEYGSKIPAKKLFQLSEVLNINLEVMMGLRSESIVISEVIQQLEGCIVKLKKI